MNPQGKVLPRNVGGQTPPSTVPSRPRMALLHCPGKWRAPQSHSPASRSMCQGVSEYRAEKGSFLGSPLHLCTCIKARVLWDSTDLLGSLLFLPLLQNFLPHPHPAQSKNDECRYPNTKHWMFPRPNPLPGCLSPYLQFFTLNCWQDQVLAEQFFFFKK